MGSGGPAMGGQVQCTSMRYMMHFSSCMKGMFCLQKFCGARAKLC